MDSLKFGTSGLRGLVRDLVGWPSYAYTLAFLKHMATAAGTDDRREFLIGRDLRSSSPEILRQCVVAARSAGFDPLDCGAVPTPALALAALSRNSPAVMITGSHIPDDRNGLKFYRPGGEITKQDEAGILDSFARLSEAERQAGKDGGEARRLAVLDDYKARYLRFFDRAALAGLDVGVYQQSSVARDLLVELLEALGAKAEPLGRASAFIPVDTEAHRREDIDLIAGWAADGRFDAIVSTDGDADRPLLADEAGRILRGDVIGLLTARHLALGTIVTPVTSSSAIETSGTADNVIRTRVGSPFVIAGMEEARASGRTGIVGFEANGGLLLGSDVERDGRHLMALPTRDAVLPILGVLAEAKAKRQTLSALAEGLNAGHTATHRLQNVAADRSAAFLSHLAGNAAYRSEFFEPVGDVLSVDRIDGVRTILRDGSIIHFRASGNAPELRCYVEASDPEKARRLLDWGLEQANAAVAS